MMGFGRTGKDYGFSVAIRRAFLLTGFLAFLVPSPVLPQTQIARPTWILFDTKNQAVLGAGLASRLGISQRALWRRSKVLPPEQLLDERDLPVSPQHLRALEAQGYRIRAVSRWLNAVSVLASESQLAGLRSLPFVRQATPVRTLQHPPIELRPAFLQRAIRKTENRHTLDYGSSLTQLTNIKVAEVHDLGIDGSGIIVGIIDNGFNNHTVHEAMKDIRVLDEYDFIHRIKSTEHQSWEGSTQGQHGALTLSALAGFKEGILVGPAYGASLILAKTEMDSVEVPAEEDLFVEALEWMEQQGADVVSSSLGYIAWYTYDSLDGQTAITTKAAKIAASKGVLLVTAMGNEGPLRSGGFTGTMIAPADADSIISVGATYSDGEIAAFSSTGPTADGRIKPEVVAQGVGVVSANGSTIGGYSFASGTSLSTPLVAGAAALVFSSNPGLTPMEVREALINTATQIDDPTDPSRNADYPNNYYGYGWVNARAAITYNGIAFSSKPTATLAGSDLTVYVSIVSNTSLIGDSLSLYYQTGPAAQLQRVQLTPTPFPYLFSAEIPGGTDSTYPRGYFSARDLNNTTGTSPFNAPDSLFLLRQFIVSSIPGVNGIPDRFLLNANFPNPFNSGTTITFDAPGLEQIQLTVFNVLGQKIRTLYAGVSLPGPNSVRWDGKDDGGRNVATGVYFYQLRTPTLVLTKKMVMVR